MSEKDKGNLLVILGCCRIKKGSKNVIFKEPFLSLT